ncbi:MAG: hypothetical protein C4527_28390 [Candidatus Omnitrophota bacterium]|jgi:predicted acyl esterase|nr:MAG: hypothetical protein C4527_28390 [Candidatus Omnitrophota bacterium]
MNAFSRKWQIKNIILENCSNSPWFEPNPNTGVPNDSLDHAVNATQTIYMGGEKHASYINLPIVGSLAGLN